MPRHAARSSSLFSLCPRDARRLSVLLLWLSSPSLLVPRSLFFVLLLRCFLLTRDRALARVLARARVRVRPLTAHRQSTTMPHSAVAVNLHPPLDIEANVLAEVALDFESVRNHLPDLLTSSSDRSLTRVSLL